VGADGRVIDARLVDPLAKDALRLQSIPGSWVFEPPLYDGKPQKIRFEIRADGTDLGPPTGGGAPIDLAGFTAQQGAGSAAKQDDAASGSLAPPRPAVRVALPAGAKPPAKPVTLRLTVAADGTVIDAAMQDSCGDATLDRMAVDGARTLVFTPAMRRRPGKKDPEPQAVYLDIESKFVAP
jgi:TonB family protein